MRRKPQQAHPWDERPPTYEEAMARGLPRGLTWLQTSDKIAVGMNTKLAESAAARATAWFAYAQMIRPPAR